MKKYTIEIDDTISTFIEDLATRINKPAEELISDAIYNVVNNLEDNIIKKFVAEIE